MTAGKCPNCGAGIAPNQAKCDYCGTALSDAPDMTWTRVDKHLPPPDPAHPGRSLYVITLELGNGITCVSKKDKKTYYNYDLFSPFLISAYYDFNTKKWFNEELGKRHGEINPTHWMAIPPKSSSAWIAATDHLPSPYPANTMGSNRTIDVLVCNQNGTFFPTVTIASAIPPSSPKDPVPLMWMCYGLTNTNVKDVHAYDISVTHWMLRPQSGPKE